MFDLTCSALKRPRHRIVFGLGVFVFVGCSAVSTEDTPSGLVLVALNDSDSQQGMANTELSKPLLARVLRDGKAVGGVPVTWNASSGTIVPASPRTNDSGYVSARWMLGDVPGTDTATASLGGEPARNLHFVANVFEELSLSKVAETDMQIGEVAQTLSMPLRVRLARRGTPVVGAQVVWNTTFGSLTVTSRTDALGIAEAQWTLPTSAGLAIATAHLLDDRYPALTFFSVGRAASFDELLTVSGDFQQLPVNSSDWQELAVKSIDRFGNAIPGIAVSWNVQSGNADVLSTEVRTDSTGISRAKLKLLAAPATVVVHARAQNRDRFFNLYATPPEYRVTLSTNVLQFISNQNGSMPAVDTIPVGSIITWRLEPFDYDEHAIESVGQPAFAGGTFPYGNPSQVRAAFPTAGTYKYRDPYYGQIGFVIVR